jgi:hypothetical protein
MILFIAFLPVAATFMRQHTAGSRFQKIICNHP